MIITCQNLGCQSEKSFEVGEGQLAWFAKKGMSPPKSCPGCREWKRANDQDEIATCSACNQKRRILGRQKIGFHRYKGVWEIPTLCRKCERNPERAKRLQRGKDQKKSYPEVIRRGGEPKSVRSKAEEEKWLRERVGNETEVVPLNVLSSAEDYDAIPDKEHGNALEHIVGGKHGKELRTYGKELDKQGILTALKNIARSPYSERVFEFQQEDGRIIKYDRKHGVVIVIGRHRTPPPSHRIITAFKKTPGAVIGKIDRGHWKPQKKRKVV